MSYSVQNKLFKFKHKNVSEKSVLKYRCVFIGCMQRITIVGCHSGKFDMFMKFIRYFLQFVSNYVCLVKRTDSVRLTAPMVMKESIWTPRAVIAKIIIGSRESVYMD